MKKGGLAILLASPKKGEDEDETMEEGGDEYAKGVESAAKDMWSAIKDDDQKSFVKAFANLCEMMKEEE